MCALSFEKISIYRLKKKKKKPEIALKIRWKKKSNWWIQRAFKKKYTIHGIWRKSTAGKNNVRESDVYLGRLIHVITVNHRYLLDPRAIAI